MIVGNTASDTIPDLEKYIGKSRVLGLDYGAKRIGIAMSDIGWIIASPVTTLETRSVFEHLLQMIHEYTVSVIVIGLPLSMGGHDGGIQDGKVKKFGQNLAHKVVQSGLQTQIRYWDERLSTKAAAVALELMGANTNCRKKHIDRVAASIILQGFLQYLHDSKQSRLFRFSNRDSTAE
ncbi:MAG: Holliday junction resolvase RuvX [Holosporales bacterium]|jgi:putative Holliday junction resolvase|nr:Holliday junction resolvase RuvX [Holosporales bacterium]